jgi:hypothetical protein
VNSGRALHRAAREALSERFSSEWCRRAPYGFLHPDFVAALERRSAWPEPESYDDLAARVPHAASTTLPSFVRQERAALERFGGYEQHVAQARAVPTRPRSWHDFFNMAIWAHFPRLRWALNAIHVDPTLGPIDPRNARAPAQNVASQLDESGIIIASSSSDLLHHLAALRFKQVFWERRAEFTASTRCWVIGHGMLESLLSPHPRLSGKALLLELPHEPEVYAADELRESIDARVAAIIDGWRGSAPALAPLPLLGLPGYAEAQDAEFYDDASYFRFERAARS